ncbi:nicotinate phosphoribosyltransferase [Spiroplasma sp. TIUS-1]|uniref:nicotinate phosphoribosyltransferase n=1 Tax=Spiroplasma sp. TIUS-1 TaxID=216963 RepID=UPI0013976DC0|nr:nicotinate phosphoribosyltransferase [Spiroplasma sp. TIUS-1]QHX36111.1 nicotinate phosphoribosyltransferase [Spiroplasma sp. TIUS-1]
MKYNIQIDKRVLDNYFCSDYFDKSQKIAKAINSKAIVTMQWFQRKDNSTVAGLEYIFEILRLSGLSNKLQIEAIEDGEVVNNLEPVLKITGKYKDFVHFEGLFDGILARATTVSTNIRTIKKAANGKAILNMNDRGDYFLNQQLDGYASYVGGVDTLVTPASTEVVAKLVAKPTGTLPHSLIALFDGDLIAALHEYKKQFPNNNLVALVDFNNDVITDSLKVANEFGKELFAVRIDTSVSIVDKSLQTLKEKDKELHGVNPTQVKMLRKALDENGFNHVKIIVSSGFDDKKIKYFEDEKTPVDIYGVGEFILSNKINFTGDLVMVNGIERSKVGRKNSSNNKLKKIIL